MDPCRHKAKSTLDLLRYKKQPLECAICRRLYIPEKKSWRKMHRVCYMTGIAAEACGVLIIAGCIPDIITEDSYRICAKVCIRQTV